jgi:putative hydrolase of the HAD superfamily
MPYQHLFFDLDHTLWDFERNAYECLHEIYDIHRLKDIGVKNLDEFLSTFSKINKKYWEMLDKNEITIEQLRRKRFQETINQLGAAISEEQGLHINDSFLELLPHKPHLIEGAIEILDYLAPKYQLHIISNGWQDVQVRKLESSEINHYFGEIITNEKANARKPHKEIFEYALKSTNASLSSSLMIGDNYEADIKGAMNINLDTVFYNPEKLQITEKPTYEIFHLEELENFL